MSGGRQGLWLVDGMCDALCILKSLALFKVQLCRI